ncbi:hypothetical protein C7S18_10135 [Ahniella affigens]|uniref:Uncharacterized protein n=1 Tax=Ahniella affigens TaxID=2021234 RepID=A0A2P1PRT3_9GAMM|nr:hypothetical protein [Ahniella affigens]AVP97532.1 hypothetical protein C7S18_10135 [Ahniella affigens]
MRRLPLLATCLLAASGASAFQLAPVASPQERDIAEISGSWLNTLTIQAATWGVYSFGDPAHEELTNRIFGCGGSICSGAGANNVPVGVMAGVRWNDDPPFRLNASEAGGTRCKTQFTVRFQTQPYCWYQLFTDAEKKAAAGKRFDGRNSNLLYRTHFGDLQFLHAMASDGDSPQKTRESMIGWTKFNWLIIEGTYTRDTELDEVDFAPLNQVFSKSGWIVQDLYALGAPKLRREIKDIAFGSILHMLQDSFAEGHLDRQSPKSTTKCSLNGNTYAGPGFIMEFHSYPAQNHSLHAAADKSAAMTAHLQEEPNVVDFGKALRTAYESSTAWENVQPFFECVFALHPNVRQPSAGGGFQVVGR